MSIDLKRLPGGAVLIIALIAPGILAQPADRFLLSPIALRARPLTDVEPQAGPLPPCGGEPIPAYPGVNEQSIVKSWGKSDLGRNWKPPACTGWTEVGFSTLVTIAARFPYTSETEGLLHHIGAISQLAGMRYWSTTHKQWRTLIVNAYALTDSKPAQRREDFTSNEMKEDKVLYFEQFETFLAKPPTECTLSRLRRADSSSMSRTLARCAITLYLSFIPVSCSRCTFWIANQIRSGATTASCVQERTPTG